MYTCDFDYCLPPDLVAQAPLEKRTASRMLVVKKRQGVLVHSSFAELPHFLNNQFMLVVNNTRVFPARMYGKKPTGGKVEILLVRQLENNHWEALVKPSGSIKEDTPITLKRYGRSLIIGKRLHADRREVFFRDGENPMNAARQAGTIPLPPYIKRTFPHNPYEELDKERYQTIFAQDDGSIAAPTASLHFDEEIISALQQRNIQRTEITLHVGPGTFLPVKSDLISEHSMESEWYHIGADAATAITAHAAAGKPLLPVGTTVVRTLESAVHPDGVVPHKSGATNLFIYPGYSFKIIRNMLTNFHLPKSTLFMLVCALAGKDLIVDAYREAIEKRYRFYSYGDAMLILDE